MSDMEDYESICAERNEELRRQARGESATEPNCPHHKDSPHDDCKDCEVEALRHELAIAQAFADSEDEEMKEQLAAMTAENERLNGVCRDYRTTQEAMFGELAAKDRHIQQLREGIHSCLNDPRMQHTDTTHHELEKAFALPHDDTALRKITEPLIQQRNDLLAAAETARSVLTLNRMPLEDYFTQPRIVEMRDACAKLDAAIAKARS
jgi:hypothetical protein